MQNTTIKTLTYQHNYRYMFPHTKLGKNPCTYSNKWYYTNIDSCLYMSNNNCHHNLPHNLCNNTAAFLRHSTYQTE